MQVRALLPAPAFATHRPNPESALGQLREAVRQNAADFLWSEKEAEWFVLTGEAPAVEPVATELRFAHDENGQPIRAELVVRIQTFLTHASAERALARGRKWWMHRLGLGNAHPMESKTLALFSFVERKKEENGGTRPSWGTLLDAWNATQRKEWRYGEERSHLRQDYERASRHLTQVGEPLRRVAMSQGRPPGRTAPLG